jgi:hypothetical protein
MVRSIWLDAAILAAGTTFIIFLLAQVLGAILPL